MFECSKFSQTPFLHRLLEIRRAAAPPTPSIAMWPPEALDLDEPHPGLYFYRPGELLVPGEQADLFRRTAAAIGVEFGDASDNGARPRGESHESVEGLEGTLLTGAARFTGVAFRGEFDPEVVITALEEEAQRAGNTLTVTPNHVVFGSQHWLVEPCGDPNTPAPGEHLERRRGGEDIVVVVIDSGLPEGYIANPLMAPVNIANNQELEPFPYEGPMPGGGTLEYAQGHGAFVCGVVRQAASEAEIWSYRALDNVGTSDEWALGIQLALAIKHKFPRVINLSLGTLTRRDQTALGLTALGRLASRTDGTAPIVVAAAGNFGWSRPFYPAFDPWTISVGAAEHRAGIWEQACFSDHGDRRSGYWVDVCAQGVDVYSSYAKQPYTPAFPPPSGPVSFDGWANWNGTSFAAPHVSGRVARILAAASPSRPIRGAVLHELSEQTFRVGSIGWFVP
jgi:subtilisin family serine protease